MTTTQRHMPTTTVPAAAAAVLLALAVAVLALGSAIVRADHSTAPMSVSRPAAVAPAVTTAGTSAIVTGIGFDAAVARAIAASEEEGPRLLLDPKAFDTALAEATAP